MRVEVVELRRRGRRLTKEEEAVATQNGRVGNLMLFQHRERSGRRTVIARLAPKPEELVASVYEQLEDVLINALRGAVFVLVGLQHERRGDKSYGVFQQAWLCRLVAPPGAQWEAI